MKIPVLPVVVPPPKMVHARKRKSLPGKVRMKLEIIEPPDEKELLSDLRLSRAYGLPRDSIPDFTFGWMLIMSYFGPRLEDLEIGVAKTFDREDYNYIHKDVARRFVQGDFGV